MRSLRAPARVGSIQGCGGRIGARGEFRGVDTRREKKFRAAETREGKNSKSSRAHAVEIRRRCARADGPVLCKNQPSQKSRRSSHAVAGRRVTKNLPSQKSRRSSRGRTRQSLSGERRKTFQVRSSFAHAVAERRATTNLPSQKSRRSRAHAVSNDKVAKSEKASIVARARRRRATINEKPSKSAYEGTTPGGVVVHVALASR